MTLALKVRTSSAKMSYRPVVGTLCIPLLAGGALSEGSSCVSVMDPFFNPATADYLFEHRCSTENRKTLSPLEIRHVYGEGISHFRFMCAILSSLAINHHIRFINGGLAAS
jgi:hypothetical protein